jgi:hypothetical protein
MRFSVEDEPDRIIDANGDEVAIELLEDDAVLIVDAVNERDRLAADEARYRTDNVRLRDIVKRLSHHLANYLTSESENDLLREARAAIGEDAP